MMMITTMMAATMTPMSAPFLELEEEVDDP
jgi:hypothetical protein